MEARRLWESPFTDHAPHGSDLLLTDKDVDGIVLVIDHVRADVVAGETVA